MYILFLILIIIYHVVFSLIGAVRQRKKPPTSPLKEKERIKSYIRIITFGWLETLVVIILCLFAGIGFYDIGLRGISLNQNVWFTTVTLILCGLFLIALIYEMISYSISAKYREEKKEELAKDTANQVVVNVLIPRSKKEKRYWFFVSLTAGIVEEFVFRGFLFFLLQAIFPNMPIPLILVVASAIFGIAHAYQGWQGMIRTAIAGALLGSLFLVTGSLILPMILHFIFDISDAFSLSEDTQSDIARG